MHGQSVAKRRQAGPTVAMFVQVPFASTRRSVSLGSAAKSARFVVRSPAQTARR
jgi:hypothetical protein